MIENLRIRNFALIDDLRMELSPGFNVITGETGAGKTIIMQAVGLLLGERASKDVLRSGSESCEISAEIKLGKSLRKSLVFLEDLGIEIPEDENIILRRTIGASSSRNFINDCPVSLQTLKTLGEILIDTHGPHEHQSVLKQSVQLDLLDRYAGLENQVSECRRLYSSWKDAIEEKDSFEKDIPDAREEDYLKHSVEEIRSAAPVEKEDEDISSRHRLISNSQAIIESAGAAVKILAESEDSMLEKLFEVNRTLLSLEKCDPDKAASFMAETEDIRTRISSLSDSLRDYAGSVEMDEKEFLRIEERIRILSTLKRKYGPEIKDVLKAAEDAEAKLEKIRNTAEIREKMDAKIAEAKAGLDKAASALGRRRKAASAKFAKEVEGELRKLGFAKSAFSVEFSTADPGPDGSDRIEFMFSANPGEPPKALRNVASSGEISRVMLALKTVLAAADSVPILIFDEIDSNIGGTTASVVGRELAKLAKTHQLLCISHLPQVASEADTHFVVEKSSRAGRTFTSICRIGGKDRIAEIARMLGGTDAALRHAMEMLSV